MEQTFRLNWRVLAPLLLTAAIVGSALGFALSAG
jgi:ABC-type sulfate transport system permease component